MSAPVSPLRRPSVGVDLVAQPEPHVERHLVVAAAAGVELVGRLADELAQAVLDPGVDVLLAGREIRLAGGDARRAAARGRRRAPPAPSPRGCRRGAGRGRARRCRRCRRARGASRSAASARTPRRPAPAGGRSARPTSVWRLPVSSSPSRAPLASSRARCATRPWIFSGRPQSFVKASPALWSKVSPAS